MGGSNYRNVLITGSCGFIGSNLMRKLMKEGGPYIFASVDQVLEPYNLPHFFDNQDHNFFMGDIADEKFMDNVFRIVQPDYILHLAAQSFVDDAITSAGPFIHSNVVGTQVLVDMAVKYGVSKFVYISTDEVYGHLPNKDDIAWTEMVAPRPRNPYAASKFAGEIILQAAHQTHGLNFNITRCCNNFGPAQPPRNLCPKILTCLLNNQLIPIHGDGKNIREWIDVRDHCSAIMTVLEKGAPNEIYNVGTGMELSNLEMVHCIADKIQKPAKIKWIPDRKGHDLRYSVNCEKIQKLGWKPQFSLDQTLDYMVEWYIAHQDRYR